MIAHIRICPDTFTPEMVVDRVAPSLTRFSILCRLVPKKFGGQMEIIGTLIIVVGLAYAVNAAWNEWREDRKAWQEIDEADKKFREEHEWKPRMVDGVDCGKWVLKDGRQFATD
jgi:hypothetical protein